MGTAAGSDAVSAATADAMPTVRAPLPSPDASSSSAAHEPSGPPADTADGGPAVSTNIGTPEMREYERDPDNEDEDGESEHAETPVFPFSRSLELLRPSMWAAALLRRPGGDAGGEGARSGGGGGNRTADREGGASDEVGSGGTAAWRTEVQTSSPLSSQPPPRIGYAEDAKTATATTAAAPTPDAPDEVDVSAGTGGGEFGAEVVGLRPHPIVGRALAELRGCRGGNKGKSRTGDTAAAAEGADGRGVMEMAGEIAGEEAMKVEDGEEEADDGAAAAGELVSVYVGRCVAEPLMRQHRLVAAASLAYFLNEVCTRHGAQTPKWTSSIRSPLAVAQAQT